MTLALTCTLCLAGAAPLAGPAGDDAGGGAATLSLASTPATPPNLRLSGPGAALATAQREHGSDEDDGEGDSRRHGGDGFWMGTTMIVVMVAMMVGVGVVMMARGGFHSAPPSAAAAAALPVRPPSGFSAPGG